MDTTGTPLTRSWSDKERHSHSNTLANRLAAERWGWLKGQWWEAENILSEFWYLIMKDRMILKNYYCSRQRQLHSVTIMRHCRVTKVSFILTEEEDWGEGENKMMRDRERQAQRSDERAWSEGEVIKIWRLLRKDKKTVGERSSNASSSAPVTPLLPPFLLTFFPLPHTLP